MVGVNERGNWKETAKKYWSSAEGAYEAAIRSSESGNAAVHTLVNDAGVSKSQILCESGTLRSSPAKE
jgi:hypothetical protein